MPHTPPIQESSVEDKNKLIVEFMGLYTYTKNEITGYTHNGVMYALRDLKYHTSWDWLMPVVEKIEKHGFYTNILSADNNPSKHTMHIALVGEEEIYTLWVDSKIEAVYQAVIKFIQWYNQQQNNHHEPTRE